MTPDPWQLPGPASFLDETVEAMRSGASLLVQFPEYGLPGYRDAARRTLARDGALLFNELPAGTVAPLELIASAFGWDRASDWLNTPAGLAESRRLEGRMLWITGVTPATWPAWSTFIERFGLACRAHHAGDGGQICLEAPSSARIQALGTDPILRVFIWRDCVSRLDVVLHLGRSAAPSKATSLERELRIAVASEIVGYDLALGVELAAAPLPELLAPVERLRAEAARRGWDGRPAVDDWCAGRSDTWEGRSFEHPASLAAMGKADVIRRRVWRAELGVIFPVLEERRIDLVAKLGKRLSAMHTDFGYVERVEDLELGSIFHQVRKQGLGDRWERQLGHMLALRNALAHTEPVQPADLVGAGLIERSSLTASGIAA